MRHLVGLALYFLFFSVRACGSGPRSASCQFKVSAVMVQVPLRILQGLTDRLSWYRFGDGRSPPREFTGAA